MKTKEEKGINVTARKQKCTSRSLWRFMLGKYEENGRKMKGQPRMIPGEKDKDERKAKVERKTKKAKPRREDGILNKTKQEEKVKRRRKKTKRAKPDQRKEGQRADHAKRR